MKKLNIALALVLVSGLISPTQAIPVEQEIDAVVFHLVGVMDTTTQAAANPKAPSVRMTTCKIQILETTEAIYLYQEPITITNKIILHSTGMDTWDRGFDAKGNQVWGVEGESYQYRWLKN